MNFERRILARLDELREIREDTEKNVMPGFNRSEQLRKIDENIILNSSLLMHLHRIHEQGTALLQ